MYSSTEFNYVIEGRVKDTDFKAMAHKLTKRGYQYYVIRAGKITTVGVTDGAPFEILRQAVNSEFGEGTL